MKNYQNNNKAVKASGASFGLCPDPVKEPGSHLFTRWVILGILVATGFGLIAQAPLPAKDPASAVSGFSEVTATNPVGAILAFPAEAAPVGYLLCDGRSVSTTDYPALYAVLGNTYGGDAANFTLPDYRGIFLRGWASDAITDPDREVRSDRGDGTAGNSIGTRQVDELRSHQHNYTDKWWLYGGRGVPEDVGNWNSHYHIDTKTTGAFGGNETRPLNTYVAYYIKATNHEVIAGNLAIGTNVQSPEERLRVEGKAVMDKAVIDSTEIGYAQISGDARIAGNTHLLGDIAISHHLDLTGDFTFSRAARLDIKPAEAAAAALSITDQGKVGIGTIDPTARFTVNGDLAAGDIAVAEVHSDTIYAKGLSVQGMIVAEEFEITMDTWPDYVFEKGYPLKSPEEIAAYIAEHGHLPAAPSAEEVLENGLKQGAFNVLLLEKVEELTLLLIRMNEQNKALKQRVEALEHGQ